jgi:protease-4
MPGWEAPSPRLAQRWGTRPAVAVVQVSGMIVPGRSRSFLVPGGMAGADTVAELVQRAAADREVRAIVVRVDSPGGDALASDLIRRAMVAARQKGKPVVVSMGDVAASGGYWIASGADQIVAEPGTITGSIGVVGLKPDLSGLLGKVGVKQETLRRGARADLWSITRPWTPEERAAVERHMRSAYQLFLQRVAEGRNLPVEQVEPLAQGRVWSGAQALEKKLVDRLGSLRDAVAMARQRAGIPAGEEVEVRRMEAPRGLLEELDLGVVQEPQAWLAGLAARSPELRTAAALAELGPVAALPAEWLEPLASPPSGTSP